MTQILTVTQSQTVPITVQVLLMPTNRIQMGMVWAMHVSPQDLAVCHPAIHVIMVMSAVAITAQEV